MRAALVAATLVSLVAAQRMTTTDESGETIVISISTRPNGAEITSTLSTITSTSSAARTTSSAARTTTPAPVASSTDDTEASASSTSSSSSSKSTAKTTTKQKGIVAAPETTVDSGPMTATTYWYPPYREPSAEWTYATWHNSFIPITQATEDVPAGTVLSTYQRKQQEAAVSDTTNGAASMASRGGVAAGVAVALGVGAGVAAVLGLGF